MDSTLSLISASTFAEFVTARSTARLQVVRSAIETYGSDYDPRTDFYKKAKDGLKKSIALGSDEPIRRAADRANDLKRPHYRELSDGWGSWQLRKQAQAAGVSGVWKHGGVEFKVRPLLTVVANKERLLVSAYLKAPQLGNDGAQALTRVMELALPGNSLRTAVLDVRRGRLIKARQRRDKDYDLVLKGEAELSGQCSSR